MAPISIFPSVKDRSYRFILTLSFLYTMVSLLVPAFRLVPRFPVPVFTFLLGYGLYRASFIPEKLKAWVFYVILVMSYWQLRFIVSTNFHDFHGSEVVALEKKIFGCLPNAWLQDRLYKGHTSWFEYIFAVFHGSLFVIPVGFALLMQWKRGTNRMKRTAAALSFLALAGYSTYILYPLTPPWMAALERLIPPLERITMRALCSMTPEGTVSLFSPSPRGAMPSLHSGVPILVLIMAFKEFGRKAWLFFPVVAGICFEVVYGAEHYVVDVMAGLLYAVIAYVLVYVILFPDRVVDGNGGLNS